MSSPRRSPAWRPRALALAGVALVFWLGFCLYRYPTMIQNQVRSASIDALAVAGISGAQLRISGRDAVLEGAVSSLDLSQQAERAIRDVRGIRHIDNRLTLASQEPVPSPPFLEIQSWQDGLTLRGPVPNEAQRDELVALAVGYVGVAAVEDQLVIDPAAANVEALASIAAIVGVMTRSEPGITARFRDHSLRLSGTLASDQARRRIDEQIRDAAGDVRTIFSLLQVATPSGAANFESQPEKDD